MNTTIGKTFGLALLMAVGVVVTMLALGMFTAKPAQAAIGQVSVVVTPTTARSIGQYTITVTGAGGVGLVEIPVGGTITVKFDDKFTVPSTITASAVKLKASIVTNSGTADQLVSAGAITVSGRSVTITVPDMDTPSSSNGDNGIGADALLTITLTQAAGIQNPNLHYDANVREVEVKTSADDTFLKSTVFSAITATVSYTPSTAARGATLTVTGRGFAKDCSDCKIRFNPGESGVVTTPTTAAEGSGTIDANGVFNGTVVLDSSTNKAGWFIWVVDSTGFGKSATASWTQKAGATPRSLTVSPGSTVTVDLVDFTKAETFDTTSIVIGGVTIGPSNADPPFALPSTSGNSTTLDPLKFKVPSGHPTGSHLVTIQEDAGATKSASFTIEVVSRVLTVTPSTASPGQSITISGTGFTKTAGTVITGGSSGLLVATSGGNSAIINFVSGQDIEIDGSGAWSFATRLPTKGTLIGTSTDITIKATDDASAPISGSTSGFKRTARTLTLTPSTAGPGQAVIVTVTGMTVDNGENTTTATFTITIPGLSGATFTAKTFPVGSDGSGTGVITIPTGATADTTVDVQAEDNADLLNPPSGSNQSVVELRADGNNSVTANLVIPTGSITVTPASASTGNTVTVTGSNFPPNTTGTLLTFGGANAIPAGGFISDSNGSFTVITEIPAATAGGSLSPGSAIVKVKVGSITGTTTAFAIPSPVIVITPSSATVEEIIVITGTGFNSLGTVDTLNIGSASAIPSPAPRAARNGDITATVLVPLLNPGTYTVVMSNGTGFSASGTFTALAAKALPAAATDATETIFADVIANDDNLVRVWRFSNADQSWAFYDPRPAFATANTLTKSGAGDIVWVNVTAEQEFQGATLFPGWNLISLK